MAFSYLSRASQLSCAVDACAKRALVRAIVDEGGSHRLFPLEPLVCFAGKNTKTVMRFWIESHLVKTFLSDLHVLTIDQFKQVDWEVVHVALEGVLMMFQIWACKQVLGLANTNDTLAKWDKSADLRCPSCRGGG